MTVIQTAGGGGTGGSTTSPLSAADVLLLHAKAGLKQAGEDEAVKAACLALGATPVGLADLLKNQTLLGQVKANDLAMACIALSQSAYDKVTGSTPSLDVSDADSMTALSQDSTRLASFCADGQLLSLMCRTAVNAGTLKVLQAVNKSKTLLQSVYDTATGSGWFTSSYTGYQDAPANLDSRITSYKECIILVATGYWSNASSQHTNVFVNGTQVSDGTTVNTRRPTSVTKANIGAIALQTATFTETSDGYAAIHVLTAKTTNK